MKYKNNLNIFTFGYKSPKDPTNWWSNFKQFFKNIKYAFQRAIRGYSDYDAWSMDTYLSCLIPVMLLSLKDRVISYPEELGSLEKWQETIEEMAQHFHNTLEWEEDIPVQKEIMDAFEKMESHIISEEYRVFFDGSYKANYTYDDQEEFEKDRAAWLDLQIKSYDFMEEEKNAAIDMLKKWYFHLWD